ncbi:TUP1-like enhancer of split-domain-containing protein [Lipomyces oligophaga]|uniref:TUP1-like enhancer of split-domain-containing protein n=1 Tax=Lipomyces oligophaga TaxID=45792 RepID=UPI0034CD3E0F
MYYVKPSWLTHSEGQKRFEVYSIHVHPDGTRLASGGLDAKVRIWSTAAIYAAVEPDDDAANGSRKQTPYSGARQLCSMSTHSGAVTVVRFSPSGRYLASGSDDRVILVWERDDEGHDKPRKEFGASGEADTEHWVVRRRCVGHDNDVQDLAWAPDSSMLVSVGLDSGIIVWSGTTFEKIKRLDIHQSHVKGITFDPANKYFATASDDRTIKIVRYHRTTPTDVTFSLDATVSAPFEGSPLTTYFRRCSWSPDASHIAAANATNGPVATVAIVNRGVWDSEINLIGHEGPVEVAAFSPRMFSKLKKSKQLVTVIACAGQDKALSVWNTSNPRPIVVSQDIAEKAITDLAWAPDGQKVFASSLDGSIVVCIFEDGDLGYIIPMEENEKQLAKYGRTRDLMHFPESVDQLALEEKSAKMAAEEGKQRMESILTGGHNGTNGKDAENNGQQIVSDPIAVSNISGPQPDSAKKNGLISESIVKSEIVQPDHEAAAKSKENPIPSGVSTAQISKPTVELTPQKQKVTITKDGRKRVAPLLVSGSAGSSGSSMLTVPEASSSVALGSSSTAVQYAEPSNRLPSGGIQGLVLGNKRKLQASEDGEREAKRKQSEDTIPEFIRPLIVSPALSISQVRLAAPKIKTLLTQEALGNGSLVFEVRNGSGGEKEPTRLTLQRKGNVLWSNFLPKMVLLACGNASFWAAACEDATIHLYSATGRSLVPTIVLESTPSFLEATGRYLACLTTAGLLYTWDIFKIRALHAPVSVASILDAAVYSDSSLHKTPSITKCSLCANGAIVVTLSNGDGYTFSTEMHAWHRISESWWAVASQYWDSSGIHGAGGIVGVVERRTDVEVKRSGKGRFLQRLVKSAMMRDGYEGIEATVSIGHLENRIEAAVLLGSAQELRTYMLMYARRIAEEGMKDRIEELFRELYGPMTEMGEAEETETKLCGLNKREILKEIIIAVGEQRAVQRIAIPYARLLGILEPSLQETALETREERKI